MSFASTEESGNNEAESGDDSNDSCPVTAVIDKVPDNTLLVLQTIQDCKQFVKYVKRLMYFFSLGCLLMLLLSAGLDQKIEQVSGYAFKLSVNVR
jgi:hypothetical protein